MVLTIISSVTLAWYIPMASALVHYFDDFHVEEPYYDSFWRHYNETKDDCDALIQKMVRHSK